MNCRYFETSIMVADINLRQSSDLQAAICPAEIPFFLPYFFCTKPVYLIHYPLLPCFPISQNETTCTSQVAWRKWSSSNFNDSVAAVCSYSRMQDLGGRWFTLAPPLLLSGWLILLKLRIQEWGRGIVLRCTLSSVCHLIECLLNELRFRGGAINCGAFYTVSNSSSKHDLFFFSFFFLLFSVLFTGFVVIYSLLQLVLHCRFKYFYLLHLLPFYYSALVKHVL